MARIPYVDDSDNPELKAVADKIRAQRGGELLNLYRILLNSPAVAEGWLQLFTAIRQQGKLPAKHRELAIMLIAVVNKANYEYGHHLAFALKAGLTQAQIDDLPRWRDSSLFDHAQRAVLDYAETMTRAVQVPDAVFEAVAHHFDAREILELTATIGGYNLVSRVLEALKVDYEQ
jgi:AhpD family alkylhydroperoxidase